MAKVLFFALSLFAVNTFGATYTTQSYLNKRSAAIAKAEKLVARMPAEEVYKEMDKTLQNLQQIMQNLIGPICIDGFPKNGKNNNTTLLKEPESGALDGIQAESLDGKTKVIISTLPLFRKWLFVAHKEHPEIPSMAELAFKTGYSYMIAPGMDIYPYKYGEIPVATSIRANVAGAILFSYMADYPAPYPPDKIGLSIIHKNLVYIFIEDIKTSVHTIPICKVAFEKPESVTSRMKALPPQDDMLPLLRSRIQEKEMQSAGGIPDKIWKAANDRFLQCFAKHLPSQNYFPTLVQQAQILIDKVEKQNKCKNLP